MSFLFLYNLNNKYICTVINLTHILIMKKKNLLAVFLLATAGLFSSCNDDDNASTPKLEGTWKAETLSYNIPGIHSGSFDFNDPYIKHGCATDYLTISENGVAQLKENNKNGENCEDEISSGTWTEEAITISGETSPRQVSSLNNNQLILIYPYTMMGHTTDVTVTYSRQ